MSLCILLGIAASACSAVQRGPDDAGLVVAAASSLAAAMPELVETFEREEGIAVDVTLASSGQIVHQITNGAPVDVFLAAEREWVRRLGADEKIAAGSETVYARGVLAVASLRASRLELMELADLGGASVGRVAIANPEHAPYGRAARRALEAAGLWDALGPRIVIGENVRQTMQYVESGAVDVAIGAGSLLREEMHSWFSVPAHLYDPIDHTLAVVAGSAREADARRFARFLLGPTGRAILARHGFDPPAPPAALTDEP